MNEKVLSIVLFVILILAKIIRQYMLEHTIGKKKILDEENKIDNLLNLNYKQIFLVFLLLIPILYITSVGMIYLTKNSVNLTMLNVTFLIILFINYEIMYFISSKNYSIEPYRDNGISNITQNIEEDSNNSDAEKYIITYYKAEPYIYTLITKKISPYDFYNTADIEINDYKVRVKSYEKYHFIMDNKIIDEIKNNKGNAKYVIVIDKVYNKQIREFLDQGFSMEEDKKYYIMKNY